MRIKRNKRTGHLVKFVRFEKEAFFKAPLCSRDAEKIQKRREDILYNLLLSSGVYIVYDKLKYDKITHIEK
jgi:hypothetical protein